MGMHVAVADLPVQAIASQTDPKPQEYFFMFLFYLKLKFMHFLHFADFIFSFFSSSTLPPATHDRPVMILFAE